MSNLTSDPNDPRLRRGADTEPTEMAAAHLVLSDEERARGFVRPVMRSYLHQPCGAVTTMATAIAETYARQPDFYGSTWCTRCRMYRPVGAEGEFIWDDPAVRQLQTPWKVGT